MSPSPLAEPAEEPAGLDHDQIQLAQPAARITGAMLELCERLGGAVVYDETSRQLVQ